MDKRVFHQSIPNMYSNEKSTDSGHLSSLDKYSKSIDSLLPSNLIKCPGLSIDIIDKISEMNLNVISTLEANEKRLQNRNRVLADMSRNCMELKIELLKSRMNCSEKERLLNSLLNEFEITCKNQDEKLSQLLAALNEARQVNSNETNEEEEEEDLTTISNELLFNADTFGLSVCSPRNSSSRPDRDVTLLTEDQSSINYDTSQMASNRLNSFEITEDLTIDQEEEEEKTKRGLLNKLKDKLKSKFKNNK